MALQIALFYLLEVSHPPVFSALESSSLSSSPSSSSPLSSITEWIELTGHRRTCMVNPFSARCNGNEDDDGVDDADEDCNV